MSSADSISNATLHQEHVFERHIVQSLVDHHAYLERDCATDYDVSAAVDRELLFQFLKSTQPDAWRTLQEHYSTQAACFA
jgi:type I restriction enzyme, R subunit